MTETELLALLGRLRALVEAERPRVAALVSALAADGRDFAATAEGQRWRDLLERSDFLPRARLLWDALGLGGLAGAPVSAGPPPSRVVQVLAEVAGSPRLEALLATLPLLGAS
jgi:hypothetical protein